MTQTRRPLYSSPLAEMIKQRLSDKWDEELRAKGYVEPPGEREKPLPLLTFLPALLLTGAVYGGVGWFIYKRRHIIAENVRGTILLLKGYSEAEISEMLRKERRSHGQ